VVWGGCLGLNTFGGMFEATVLDGLEEGSLEEKVAEARRVNRHVSRTSNPSRTFVVVVVVVVIFVVVRLQITTLPCRVVFVRQHLEI